MHGIYQINEFSNAQTRARKLRNRLIALVVLALVASLVKAAL